jgi:hypothetical protein
MKPSIRSLTANLVANFVTVVVPAPRWAWDRTRMDHPLTLDEIEEYRTRFRRELSRHGEGRCLDCIEIDALGNWRIHFFPLNEEAIPILENTAMTLSGVACGPGEAAGIDPEVFVATRLDRLENQGQLTGRYPWWVDQPAIVGADATCCHRCGDSVLSSVAIIPTCPATLSFTLGPVLIDR